MSRFYTNLGYFGTYSEGGCVIYLFDIICLMIFEQYNLLQVQWSFPHRNRYIFERFTDAEGLLKLQVATVGHGLAGIQFIIVVETPGQRLITSTTAH